MTVFFIGSSVQQHLLLPTIKALLFHPASAGFVEVAFVAVRVTITIAPLIFALLIPLIISRRRKGNFR